MIGPVLGSMIYGQLGYENTFFTFAGILLASCALVFFILPKRLNKLDADLDALAEDQERSSNHQPAKQVTFSMFLLNTRAMLAVFSSMIAMVFMLFYNSILAVELASMGVGVDSVGYIFALGALMYALSSPLVSIVFKGMPRRYITQIAFIVSSVALFLFGPSKLLGFPDSLGIMIGGIVLLGIAISLIFVPLLSEIIDAVQEKEGLPENPTLNDKASAVFNSAYATGCIIGPIVGGCLSDAYGFRTTCDIMALASCSFAVIYFFGNILPNCFTKKKAPVVSQEIGS